MRKITFENSRMQSIIIKDYVLASTEYKMLGLEIDPFETEGITSKGYQQNGVTFKYTQGNPRLVSFTGLIYCDGFTDAFEQEELLKTIFNPMLGEGTLTYENDAIDRNSIARVVGQPIIPSFKNYTSNTFSVIMQMDDPFFYDIDYTEVELIGVTGGLEFDSPTFSFESGTSFTVGDISASSGVITNNGHAPAPLLIEWTGVATDPKLLLEDTGEFILLNGSLTSDQRLIITTGYGNKRVAIETISTGAIVYDSSIVDDTSTFFSAPIGNSTISFSAVSGGSTSVVTVKLKQLWT